MRYKKINSKLFIENRKAFTAKMKKNSIAIFFSSDEQPKNGDQFFNFQQSSDFFYLTGISQEKSVLVLFPDSPIKEFKEVLFILETNKQIAIWEGHKFTQKEAQEISGIKTAKWLDEQHFIINQLMVYAYHCYLNKYEYPKYQSEVESCESRLNKKIKLQFPEHQYERSAPIVNALRIIKSDIEIELIKQACEITNKAFRRILKYIKPNVTEFEIQAEIEHEFTINRANGHAYAPIIASGENACVLHYIENNKTCQDGDMLLFDFGAEYAHYASDMSRTIPVSGKFTKRQKQVYEAVLRTQKKLISSMIIGSHLTDLDEKAKKLTEEELISLGLYSKAEKEAEKEEYELLKKYFMHGVSHHMGLDVHDVGNRLQPLTEGMVLTCEPGIYIKEEKIGIRLENDILITKNGPVNLMNNIPIEISDIETLMAQ